MLQWWLSTQRSPEYILPVAQSPSVTLVSPYTHPDTWKMYLEAMIARVGRCTWRPRSSEPRDALWVCNKGSLETAIERVWGCTWTPWSSEFGDALVDLHGVNSEMHWETVIEEVWRQRCSEFGDALGGQDQPSLEIHLEAKMEWTQRCTWRPWSRDTGDTLADYNWARLEEYVEVVDWGRTWCWDSIYWLTHNWGNMESWIQQHQPGDERLAGRKWQSKLGWCSTWCMLYLVWIHYHGIEK